MPLNVLLPIVIVGIAGIAVLLHLLGRTAPRRLSDAEEALQAWAREYPDETAIEAWPSADLRAALILLVDGRAGLVWCMGDDTVARLLEHFDLLDTETGLDLRLQDISAPHVSVRLSEPDRRRWKEFILA
jgi:hypothetical protein